MVSREPSPFPARGVLWHASSEGQLAHGRHLPAPELRELVEHYWFAQWDLRGLAPIVQETLPHPSVHWVTEAGHSACHGVPRGRFTRALAGLGGAFGVKFQPGGFHPFLRSSVAGIAGREVALAAVFGPDGAALAQRLARFAGEGGAGAAGDPGTEERLMDIAERFLLDRLPPRDEQLPAVQTIVQAIMSDREINRVDDLVARFGLHKRALQRLFAQYVGASPKWVIQRYRLHEAVERVAAGEAVSWSQLALDLGYFDQAHFIRDFKALIGRSPAGYARELAR
jgi:AraC-like DNA-binding protein